MTMRVFENWTPESVPCPRCRTLLPSADATCPRCGHEATSAVPAQPIPTYHAATTEPTYPGVPSWPTAPPPGPVPPPFYPVVRPARRGPRVGRIVLVILVVAVLGAGAYGLHRVTQHAEKQLADQSVPTATAPTLEPLTTTSLSAIPVQVGELPYGWTTDPPDTSSTSDSMSDAEMDACMGIHVTDPTFGPKAETHFDLDKASWINSVAQQIPSRASLRPELAALKSPKAPHCMAMSIRAGIASTGSGIVLHGFRLHVARGLKGGPHNIVWLMTARATLSANGRRVGLYLQSVLIASNDVGASVDILGIGVPIDLALRNRLIDAVSGRVAQYKP